MNRSKKISGGRDANLHEHRRRAESETPVPMTSQATRHRGFAPMMSHFRAIGLALLVLAVVPPRLPATIVLNTRLSQAGALADGGANRDMPPVMERTDFLPADLSASAAAADGDTSASASASLHSDITLDTAAGTLRVTGNGATSGEATYGQGTMKGSVGSGGALVIDLNFDLTAVSYTYTLTGQMSASSGDGQYNGDCQALLLSTTTIFAVITQTGETKLLSESGTLPPGNYRLFIRAQGSAPATLLELPHSLGNANASFVFTLEPAGSPTPTPTPTPILHR